MSTTRVMLAELIGTFFLCFAGIAAILSTQSPVDSGAGPTATVPRVASDVGGVLFLVHAVTVLDLPAALLAGPLGARDVPEVLARVVAAAAGVDRTDPAVLATAGWRGADPSGALRDPLPETDEAIVQAHAGALRAWVAARLGEEPGADLTWVWSRHAVIDARPGWIEAVFSLEDVDLRVRRAGLDLDPGAVWWLGGVVRFRYA